MQQNQALILSWFQTSLSVVSIYVIAILHLLHLIGQLFSGLLKNKDCGSKQRL